MLGKYPSSAGEAARAPRLWLVRAHRAGLAGPEAIRGEEAWGALTWKSEVTAQAGRRGHLGPDPALSPPLPWGRALRGWWEGPGPSLDVASGSGALGPWPGLLDPSHWQEGLRVKEQVALLLSWDVRGWRRSLTSEGLPPGEGPHCALARGTGAPGWHTLSVCRAGPSRGRGLVRSLRAPLGRREGTAHPEGSRM